MAYDRRALTGVGGWLAFLVVTLWLSTAIAVVGVLMLALRPPQVAAPGWGRYVIAGIVLGTVRAAGYGYLAWRLNARQQAGTPRIVILGLWLLALAVALDAAAAAVFLGLAPSMVGTTMAVGAARPAFYAAIWTAYLLRSQRVANTYAPAEDGLAAVFR